MSKDANLLTLLRWQIQAEKDGNGTTCHVPQGGRLKRRYHTVADAMADADHYRRKSGDRTRPYRCRHCGGWHLTSTEARTGEPKAHQLKATTRSVKA